MSQNSATGNEKCEDGLRLRAERVSWVRPLSEPRFPHLSRGDNAACLRAFVRGGGAKPRATVFERAHFKPSSFIYDLGGLGQERTSLSFGFSMRGGGRGQGEA